MARIAGVDIPREKRTVIALTYIFGVGPTIAQQVCAATGVDESTRVKDLSEADVNKLRAYIDQNVTVEGDLRRDVAQDIKRKMETVSYTHLSPSPGAACGGAARR